MIYSQNGCAALRFNRGPNIAPQIWLVIHEFHSATAKDKRRPHQQGVTDSMSNRYSFFHAHGRSAWRSSQSQFIEHRGEKFSVLGRLDTFGLRADNRDAGGFQSIGQIKRSLPAELHDHTLGKFLFVNIEHVLECERLEVEFVARVVIGRNRFGIRIDHDCFEAELAQRESRVYTAIVELDTLTDAVRTAAQNHDFAFRARPNLILAAVRGIIIWSKRFELRRARIDQAIGGKHTGGLALCANFFFAQPDSNRDLTVGEAELFRARKAHLLWHSHLGREFSALQFIRINQRGPRLQKDPARVGVQLTGSKAVPLLHNLLNIPQKPSIDFRQRENFFDLHPILERLRQMKDALGVRHAQVTAQCLRIDPLLIAVAA